MEIDINRVALTWGERYAIFVNKQQMYIGAIKAFKFYGTIGLFRHRNEDPLITVKRTSYFRLCYGISRPGKEDMVLKSKGLWSQTYICQDGKDEYAIYAHVGLRHSVFKNNVQVAYWDKSSVNWFDGENYKIIADSDCDKELIISFCLIFDDFSGSMSKTEAVSLDVGSLNEDREFNKNWHPK